MLEVLADHPGLWFVAATLMPLISVVVLLLAGFLRNALRRTKNTGSVGAVLFELLGGEVTGRGPAYVATAAIFLAFVCSFIGFIIFVTEDHHGHAAAHSPPHPVHKEDKGHDHEKHSKAGGGKKSAAKQGDPMVELVVATNKLTWALSDLQSASTTAMELKANLDRLKAVAGLASEDLGDSTKIAQVQLAEALRSEQGAYHRVVAHFKKYLAATQRLIWSGTPAKQPEGRLEKLEANPVVQAARLHETERAGPLDRGLFEEKRAAAIADLDEADSTLEALLASRHGLQKLADRRKDLLDQFEALKAATGEGFSESIGRIKSSMAAAAIDKEIADHNVEVAFDQFLVAAQQVVWFEEQAKHSEEPQKTEKKTKEAPKAEPKKHEAHDEKHGEKHDAHDAEHAEEEHGSRWSGSTDWAVVTPRTNGPDAERAAALRIGYYIDSLSATMFMMVTFIATLIHIFSIGYMGDELKTTVEDHEVHTAHGHFHRRGRFGRFFMFLSLFSFSMLNLILADNLFQVFVSWELVGVCSYLLIGFYYERTSASNAANKAFITNRVGDAGFIIGLLIVWTYVGTLNFQEIFERIRCPVVSANVVQQHAWQVVGADLDGPMEKNGDAVLEIKKPGQPGQYAVLFPRHVDHAEFKGTVKEDNREGPAPAKRTLLARKNPGVDDFSYIPYWMLVTAGLGIFLGCVGKSAQFPLQVWLPDAMEGPTPVSALIHAATMVAAGVYLVGRCYPLFTLEVTLTIAYIGAITLFVAATIAVVMTDIKKVLAYSTVSQLGYMMLALGIGGWVAGLFHLVTHAFFKALLFLCSGSVIYGCHHQQDMTKMGGLFPKMKITALTMLMGVLAISGVPLFSGWYSKDAIIAQAFAFGFMTFKQHLLLFLLPLFTAGLTAFYMFRMWFMTFAGKPKDDDVHEHAAESPWVMTVPLIILAFFSVTVAWGMPIFDPEASALEHFLHHAQPNSVKGDFGLAKELGESTDVTVMVDGKPKVMPGPNLKDAAQNVSQSAKDNHGFAGLLALGSALLGFIFAALLYVRYRIDPADAVAQFPGVYRFLQHKWCFDELYSVALVRPSLIVAQWAKWFDTHVIDGILHLAAKVTLIFSWLSGLNDRDVIDGLANLIARVCQGIGGGLRHVQTGYLRSYVLFLVLAVLGLWILLNAYYLGAAPVTR